MNKETLHTESQEILENIEINDEPLQECILVVDSLSSDFYAKISKMFMMILIFLAFGLFGTGNSFHKNIMKYQKIYDLSNESYSNKKGNSINLIIDQNISRFVTDLNVSIKFLNASVNTQKYFSSQTIPIFKKGEKYFEKGETQFYNFTIDENYTTNSEFIIYNLKSFKTRSLQFNVISDYFPSKQIECIIEGFSELSFLFNIVENLFFTLSQVYVLFHFLKSIASMKKDILQEVILTKYLLIASIFYNDIFIFVSNFLNETEFNIFHSIDQLIKNFFYAYSMVMIISLFIFIYNRESKSNFIFPVLYSILVFVLISFFSISLIFPFLIYLIILLYYILHSYSKKKENYRVRFERYAYTLVFYLIIETILQIIPLLLSVEDQGFIQIIQDAIVNCFVMTLAYFHTNEDYEFRKYKNPGDEEVENPFDFYDRKEEGEFESLGDGYEKFGALNLF
ncbi:hypothetical protein TRFO_18606 [Tritrichomonas foetus]|uniref:Uncharacterized protein n=1 Tax=Tritrichomonas foetus TaxID=1144522 RepID=A0A1J4KL03_9EUKA|nr:hypothetical protein TRFO_18606 [Tritrichomonas foetus]|eukprot:OHT11818.1 hypothetical protein TRFO_18606 [Tritrichomonas foetus]